jgi:hypothetical protein
MSRLMISYLLHRIGAKKKLATKRSSRMKDSEPTIFLFINWIYKVSPIVIYTINEIVFH